MTVRCSEYKDCPKTKCPHYKEHEPYLNLEYIGGKGEVLTPCNEITRTCGQREPWIEVRCAEVKDEPVKMAAMNATTKVTELELART